MLFFFKYSTFKWFINLFIYKLFENRNKQFFFSSYDNFPKRDRFYIQTVFLTFIVCRLLCAIILHDSFDLHDTIYRLLRGKDSLSLVCEQIFYLRTRTRIYAHNITCSSLRNSIDFVFPFWDNLFVFLSFIPIRFVHRVGTDYAAYYLYVCKTYT